MADSKLTGLTADTAPTSDDLVYTNTDPGGTPLDRKATLSNLSKGLVADNIPNTPAGSIAATDVQAAIDELDSEKATSAQGALADSAMQDLVEDTTPQLGGNLDGQGFDQTKMGTISLTEQAAANADVAGDGQVWVKTATPNELWYTDDAGTDFQVNGVEVTGTSGQIYVFNGSNVLIAVTMSGDGTITNAGVLDIASLSDVLIQDYAIESAAAPATTGTITLDYANGPDFTVTLTGNATIAFTGWPTSGTLGKITIEVTNGSSAYTLDITTNVDLWPDGTVPTFTASIGAIDEFIFWTRDGGTTVKGATPGQAFA